ncbi:hypothetical protein AMS66_17310 [Paenibacillus xylanivorans]|uniref:Uncharacterized protein n=1 Tax=Paenibacillus xylanivorans TaxID=1705561 RepID=A0A0N1IWM4_9BACL|nr:hypothetical protein AMS66_17310 [Paenibacillus xylanivorans]
MVSMTDLELSEQVDNIRSEASEKSSKLKKKKFSQYFTGHKLSNFMAEFTSINSDHVRILDQVKGVNR